MTDLGDIPGPKTRRRVTPRGTAPQDLPAWLTGLGDIGGLRFGLSCIHPQYRRFAPVFRPITEDEIHAKGSGIYEIQAEKQDARGIWRAHGRPRQVTVPDQFGRDLSGFAGAAVRAGGVPVDPTVAALLVDVRRELSEVKRAPQYPQHSPYGAGPSIPADSVDELKRTHRETIESLKQDHREALEQLRALWTDRLDNAKANSETHSELLKSRIRELERRCERLDADASEARTKSTNPVKETLATFKQIEEFKATIGTGDSSPDVPEGPLGWLQIALANPSGVGDLLERVQSVRGAGGSIPTPGAMALPAPHPAPPPLPSPGAPAKAPESEKAALATALEGFLAAGKTPTDAYTSIAPLIGPDALFAAAASTPDAFAQAIYRPSAQTSPLRFPEGRAWLLELHALIVRLNKPAAPPAPAPVPATEEATA